MLRKRPKRYQCQLMTEEQCGWLERNYVQISVRDMTDLFNRKYGTSIETGQMKTFISNRGFKSGRTGCYSKGDVPANKGKKMPAGWAPGRMRETQFKPGHSQTEIKPIGHERTDRDGYIWIKCDILNPHTGAQGHYLMKHRLMWEEEHGPIGPNDIVTFLDDDRGNVTPENLECIPRGELVRRNKLKYLEAPPELRASIKALAKLQHYTGQVARK